MKRVNSVIGVICSILLVLALAVPVSAGDAGKLDINKATVKELAKLERIGQKTAEKIVQFREANGPFKAPQDIQKVPGVGKRAWEVNKDKITVK